MLKIYDLTVEYRKNPLGIDELHPRFAWKLISGQKGVLQESYQIRVWSDASMQELIYDTGRVASRQSYAIRYNGKKLTSMESAWWAVTITARDESGSEETAASSLQRFEMGLLKETDWKAEWIEPEEEVEIDGRMPAPYLRKEFTVRPQLKSARIFQSAHGLYEFWINGQAATDEKFKPGLTSYYKRLQYQTYDITSLLREGNNCLAVVLGDGWWRGNTGGAYRNNFGYKLAYLGQIVLTYEDGTREYIVSDESFHTSTGAIRTNDMKEGELFDAGMEPDGWKKPGFDDSGWSAVHLERDEYAIKSNLVSSRSVPAREMETFRPKVVHTPNGETVLDFGQNIAGYVRMTLKNLKKGQKIEILHGETFDEEGNFTQKNIILENPEAMIQKVTYIAKGEKEETYQPAFAIFGFQLAKITGLDEVNPEDFTAVAVYSDMGDTGDFRCSNELINQLVSNSRWSQKGNFMDVPTDCPQRERSPWSGDSQVYAKTAAGFMNVYPFFEKWMLDLQHEQFASGKVPNTMPRTAAVHNPLELERKKKKWKRCRRAPC